jgi:DNA (cytosine-5)-methyltransferase 1
MKVVSLFTGCGGTDLGFKLAGHDIIYANDIDGNACKTYKKNFPGVTIVHEDIINVKQFPEADILVGCYPCQGFSIAGKRNPKDERNLLYLHFARALRQTKPKFFVAENVKGMLTLANSKLFKNMLKLFRRCGYKVKYKLINAKYLGLPQDRERVFIVGVRKDLDFDYQFPADEFDDKNYNDLRIAFNNLKEHNGKRICNAKFSYIYMSRDRRRKWDEASFTIQAGGQHAPLHPNSSDMVKVGVDKLKFKSKKHRRLSYRECARIQSFPDSFEFKGKLLSKYRQIGNAVPPLIAYKIARSLAKDTTDKKELGYEEIISLNINS